MSETPRKSPYQDMVEAAFAEALPLSAQFEITYRCNHLCTFCYNAPNGQRELTTPQIFETLRKVRDFGVMYLTLTGGEAMCHRDFWKIAKETRRLGMALRIYSNGYLMADPRVVRKIKALNPLEVEISLHGARAETHEALTKIKGSFDKTLQAIGNLVEAGIRVNLKCPITRLNQEELFEMKEIAEKFGLFMNFDAVLVPKDDGDTSPLDLRPTDEFYARYWSEDYLKLHNGRMPPKKNHCASEGSEANCGTGRSGFTIDPYGNILPCVAFRRTVANVLDVETIDEVWQTSPVLEEVRDISVKAADKLKKHELGEYVQFCMGVAETQTGDPLALYTQAEVNARSVKKAYDLVQIDGSDDRKTA